MGRELKHMTLSRKLPFTWTLGVRTDLPTLLHRKQFTIPQRRNSKLKSVLRHCMTGQKLID
jgi:hypothetical protein